MWKGDDAKQGSLHRWLRAHYPKTGRCEQCWRMRKTDYAFLRFPRAYTRDIRDYMELCIPCHREFDRLNGQTPYWRRRKASAAEFGS